MLDRQRLSRLLGEHHRAISVVLEQAEEVLDQPGAPRAETLASLRWQLLRLLRAYQLFKHVEIFDRIIGDGKSPGAPAASAMKARCIGVGEAYDRHVKKWSFEGITDWPSYKGDKIVVIRTIRSHLLREEIGIRALMPAPTPGGAVMNAAG